MYIEAVPNRSSPPAVLLRESYREGGKVRKRTLANLTHWPPDLVQGLRTLLKGGLAVARAEDAFLIRRSLPHGHVAAVLGMVNKLGLGRLLGRKAERRRQLVLAMIVARVLDPVSKLATARLLNAATASSTLGPVLGVDEVDEDELYAALDWLLARQARIETALARRHLREGTLVLYDVTSSYLEGRACELARFGFSRDGKKGKLQIVFGLMCAADGCPVAVEVFEGDRGDPTTLAVQIGKLKERFGLRRVVLVGDRGMITAARIEEDLKPAGLDWITALRAPAIRALVDGGALQLSLFDERDLAEIASPDYPGERLVVCRNPLLAEARARKREDLLVATEKDLARIAAATARARAPLRGSDKIALKAGAVLGRYKMAKHFRLSITDHGFAYERDEERIAAEAALDGFYVMRTNVPAEALDAAGAVTAYKGLCRAERAFRSLKSVDLKVRPIHHRLAERVRAHVFLCVLAYYVEWHMRKALAAILFDDHDTQSAEALRASIVAPARRSPRAHGKAATKRTEDGLPVHSFQTLLKDLATLTNNTVATSLNPDATFNLLATLTPTQRRAFELLGVRPKV
jgi:transposase